MFSNFSSDVALRNILAYQNHLNVHSHLIPSVSHLIFVRTKRNQNRQEGSIVNSTRKPSEAFEKVGIKKSLPAWLIDLVV